MNKEIYVLREDFYNEWAWENGSTILIMANDCIETIVSTLRKHLNMELEEDEERILQNTDTSIDEIITSAIYDLENNNNVYVDIYTNEHDYNMGCNNGTYVIEKMEVE